VVRLLDVPVYFGLGIEALSIMIIMGIISFFFWKWFLAKFIADKQRTLIFACFATLVSTPLIYNVLVFIIILSV
jgi:hypothetical protein